MNNVPPVIDHEVSKELLEVESSVFSHDNSNEDQKDFIVLSCLDDNAAIRCFKLSQSIHNGNVGLDDCEFHPQSNRIGDDLMKKRPPSSLQFHGASDKSITDESLIQQQKSRVWTPLEMAKPGWFHNASSEENMQLSIK